MYSMIKPTIRKGICIVSVRFARDNNNNKHIGFLYDQTLPTFYILYVDESNLFRSTMSKLLLDNNFTI